MTSDTEQILRDSVHRQELLRLSHGLEPLHSAFPLASRLMRDFHPTIRVSSGFVDNRRHGRPMRCAIALHLVRDQLTRCVSLSFQQLAEKALGGTSVATRLHQDIDYVTILVNDTPEVMSLTLDGHEQLIDVPDVAQAALPPL